MGLLNFYYGDFGPKIGHKTGKYIKPRSLKTSVDWNLILDLEYLLLNWDFA